MPRLGDEPSGQRRLYKTMALVALSIVLLAAIAHLYQTPSVSLRAWIESKVQGYTYAGDDDVDSLGRHRKLDGLTMMEHLPRHVIPTADNGRRLVIIGDIHGMDKELDKLLKHISYDGDTDHIIAAGDMVNKGPHSGKVVGRLMELGASAVRGNHEDHVLLAIASASERKGADAGVTYPDFQARRSKKSDLATARQLSNAQIKWLAEKPLILSAERLDMYIVHAGLVPGIRPLKQDPWAVMNMRSLIAPSKSRSQTVDQDAEYLAEVGRTEDGEDTEGGDSDVESENLPSELIPVDTHEGQKWARLWNKRQERISKPNRRTVVYGHDAKLGLKVDRYTFGLDSACVNGGQLTALVIHVSKMGQLRQDIMQVPCDKYNR